MGDEKPGRAEDALQLGALPEELHERLRAVERSGGGPPHLLLEAVLSVGRGLELPQVLRRIVEAAVVLVDAEYGALGVLGDDSRISHADRSGRGRRPGDDRDHAVRILSADLGVLALPEDDDNLRVALAFGVDAEVHRGLVLPGRGSFVGAALTARTPLSSLDIEHDPRITAGPPRWAGLGPAVAVP
ncbi:hypothetical protein BKA18_000469 [Streptomyces auratus]